MASGYPFLKNSYWILRHGKSIPNEKGLIVSSMENGTLKQYELASEGVDQARLAGELFLKELREKNIGLENVRICYSPFSRTRHTAEMVASVLDISLEGPQCKSSAVSKLHRPPSSSLSSSKFIVKFIQIPVFYLHTFCQNFVLVMSANPGNNNIGSRTTAVTEDPNSPYFLPHSENHSSVTVIPELTATNYATWRRSFLLAVSIRNKQGFLDKSIPKPAATADTYLPWIRCNNLMVAWLLRSISQPIASTVFFYLDDASLIWDKLEQRFSQPDESKICNLQYQLSSLTQGNKSVDTYFTELHGIWEELRAYRPLPHCKCGKCNNECFQEFANAQNKDFVFKFLNGLNEMYQALHSQIIIMKPFPNLDQVYNLVLREETQRVYMSQQQSFSEMSSAMAVKRGKGDLTCNHCGKKGHTKDKCYRIIGFPSDFKFTRGRKASANAIMEESTSPLGQPVISNFSQLRLSQQQVHKLLSLLDTSSADAPSNQSHSPAIANLAGPFIMDEDWAC